MEHKKFNEIKEKISENKEKKTENNSKKKKLEKKTIVQDLKDAAVDVATIISLIN